MKIIGHRGAAARAPENSVEAIRRAFADGADAVEVDVRLTADGGAVLHHDPTAGDPAIRVAAAGLDEVRVAVPWLATLAEGWEAADGRMVIEIKGEWGTGRAAQTAAAVAAFLEGRDTAAAVVSSFDLTALEAFRAAGGTAATGVLTPDAVDPLVNVEMAVAGGHAVCYLPAVAEPAPAIAAAHAAGRAAVIWTVNDPDRIRACAAARADGIITDDPAAARLALGS